MVTTPERIWPQPLATAPPVHPGAGPQEESHQAAERREVSLQVQVCRHQVAWRQEASFPVGWRQEGSFPVAQPLEGASQGERRQGMASSPPSLACHWAPA
jgi:hypothetical protein